MEKNLEELKAKRQKASKILTCIIGSLAIVLIGLMIAWLLVRKNNNTAMIVLSIIAGVFVLLIAVACTIYYLNKKKLDSIQAELDNND